MKGSVYLTIAIFLVFMLSGIMLSYFFNGTMDLLSNLMYGESAKALRSMNNSIVSLPDYEEEKNIIEAIFSNQESGQAYTHLKKRYGRFDQKLVHGLMHDIGRTLYVREGIDGVTFCDGSFNWGCYHGFFGTALVGEGGGGLFKMEGACLRIKGGPQNFGGCIHGIGHGVLALRGYTYDGLMEALGDCGSFSSQFSREGCYNGVFMEYNIRAMRHGGMPSENDNDYGVRRFDPQSPNEPCSTLPSNFQPFCYYEQPAWWTIVLESDYMKIGVLCSKVTKSESRESCFRGIGRIIKSNIGYPAGGILSGCKSIPMEEGFSNCVYEAVRLFSSEGVDSSWLCQELAPKSKGRCIKEASF